MPDETMPRLEFETAAEHLCRNVPVLSPATSASQGRALLTGTRFEFAGDIAVCDGGRLVGLVPIEALLAADDGTPMRDVMDADPPVVRLAEDQEVAAWKAVQHGEHSIALVEDGQRFVGFIPPRSLLSVLLMEHHEDMARLAGVLRSTQTARAPLEEPILRRFAHRIPWLVVGLIGALLAADAVAWFERDLQANLTLAFFLPGIVYLADAVGTQTETLAVRGLSVGLAMRGIVWREVITGLAIGAGLAAVAAPLTWWRWNAPEVTLVLSLSLIGTCAVATGVAIVLPWWINRMGGDPALGSGPLATVIQDLLSILIYLGIGSAVLH